MTPEEFRNLRDSRTQSCESNSDYRSAKVAIVAGRCVETEAGQMMVLTTAALLARFCYRLDVLVPDVPCILRPYKASNGFHSVIREAVTDADPWAELGLGEQLQSDHTYVLQIGEPVDGHLSPDFTIDANGWVACAGQGAIDFGCDITSANVIAAAQSATIGVADAFKVATNQPAGVRVARTYFSTFYWTLQSNPEDKAPSIAAALPLNLARLVIVGAGAVGSNILHFLRFLPHADTTVTVIDHDAVDYSNLNRCLPFGYKDVGLYKADVVTRQLLHSGIDTTSFVGRFDEYIGHSKHLNADIVLPVANEHGVRWAIQSNIPPLMLQGSTGRGWTINVGRHIPSVDFCLACCFPHTSDTRMSCGAGQLPGESSGSADAALPFVSPWAAILVVGEMAKLNLAGYPFTKSRLSMESYGPLGSVDHFSGQKARSCICADVSNNLFHKIRGDTRFAHLSRR